MDATSLTKVKQETGLRLSPLGRRLTPLAWTFLNNPPIERWFDEPIDVVHALALGYPVATRKPFVVTVHDLGPLTHPEYFTNTKPWIMQRSLAQAVKQAAAIICVSESTANELIAYVGGSISDRIHVIYEGVSAAFFDQSDTENIPLLTGLPNAETPYILATGKISPRKNIHGLIHALSKLMDEIPHHLVLVGGDGWGMKEIFNQLGDSRLSERVHSIGYVSDEQLRSLYAGASVYVHPSLYEGFGLTILEGMAMGCPVVTSNVYSLPEVAGDAALLVDPLNIQQLADAIAQVCKDEGLRAELKRKGQQRARMFSWQSTAEQVAQVYATIA